MNGLWCISYQRPLRISSIGKLKPLLFWASVVLVRVSHAKMEYTKVQNPNSVSIILIKCKNIYMYYVTAVSLGTGGGWGWG